MRVSVVTPDSSYYDGTATAITLPAHDGLLGVRPGHAPLIARLGHGVAEVVEKSGSHRIAIYGGFLKVQNDMVTVLAGGAALPDEGDAADAKAALTRAEAELKKLEEAGTKGAEVAEATEALYRARAFAELLTGKGASTTDVALEA